MDAVPLVETGFLLFSEFLLSMSSAMSYNEMRNCAFVGGISLWLCWLNLCCVLYLVFYSLTFGYDFIYALFSKCLHFLREMLGCFLNICEQSVATD